MKNKITLMLVIITLMMVIPMINADLGTYPQNSCIQIKTILNSTTANISSISYPNSTIILTNQAMTKVGSTFNYTFCNTSTLGTYVYDYFDDKGNVYVNDFTITSTGYEASISQSITMFIIIGILIIAIILFFLVGMALDYIPFKILFLSLAVILIVFTIGYILQIANITIGEFKSLTDGFTPLYVTFITLLIAGGIGIILYLIASVFKTFQKTRYGID